ncbi:MAG: hypothetical protein JWP48_816 [Actinoallomurus sp.]|nr:hypothetical protein [Actinoallomurus sp.]
MADSAEVTCPACGHSFEPDAPVRMTESAEYRIEGSVWDERALLEVGRRAL